MTKNTSSIYNICKYCDNIWKEGLFLNYNDIFVNDACEWTGNLWVLESDSEYDVLDNRHDKGYKYLLSIKRLFLQLLKSFVEQGWVESIDEGSVERIDKSFILNDFKEKEADIVYRVKLGDKDVLFYMLLELQSTVDFQMPYRLLLYMIEIWRNVLKDTGEKAAARKGFKLPVIVPCVLYNGDDRWTACKSFAEMLDADESLSEYILDFKYILFDVKRYDEKKLLELANVIGAVFYIDQKKQFEEMHRRIKALMGRLGGISREDFEAFKIWLMNIAISRMKSEEVDVIRSAIKGSGEVDEMVYAIEIALRDKFREIEHEATEKGFKEGINKGIKEGIKEARVGDILELLEDYGEVPENLKREIYAQEDPVLLSKWLKIAARVNDIAEFEKTINNI